MMYKAFNTLLDKITGFDINKELEKILEFNFLPRNQIEEFHKEKFDILKKYAAKSPFYKTYLAKDIKEFPIITRDFIQLNFEKFKTNFRTPYRIVYTSGSTGVPMKIFVSKEMLLAKRVSHQKMLNWHCLTRESPELKIGGLKSGIISQIYFYLKNKRHIHSFNISNKNINDIIRLFNNFKPELLYGYPSVIYFLLSYAKNNNIDLNPPKLIATHAENLYTEMKTLFTNVFPNTPVANQYWSTEANIGVTCPKGNMHVDEDTIICELTDMDENGVGDLVLTCLYSYDFPFIRYKTGDRVKISDKKCPCGRNTKIIEKIEGRTIEYLQLPDGKNIALTSDNPIPYLGNVLYYQYIYKQKSDNIHMKVVPINKDKTIDIKGIINYYKRTYNLNMKIEIVEKTELSKSGKFKRIIFTD